MRYLVVGVLLLCPSLAIAQSPYQYKVEMRKQAVYEKAKERRQVEVAAMRWRKGIIDPIAVIQAMNTRTVNYNSR